MKINLLFSMDGPRLSDEQAGLFAAFGEWVVLNEREGRLLVDAVGDYEDIAAAMTALAAIGRAPHTIGGWTQDGEQLASYPLDEAAWLLVAPDDWDYSDPENPVASRPTAWQEIHRWAGWSAKQTI